MHCVVFVSLSRREAEIHYLMRHPKVVEIIAFGLGDSERRPCMIMELMQESLYDLLGVHGIALPMLDALSIIRDMCEVCGTREVVLCIICGEDSRSGETQCSSEEWKVKRLKWP